jgi:hypothetical protein
MESNNYKELFSDFENRVNSLEQKHPKDFETIDSFKYDIYSETAKGKPSLTLSSSIYIRTRVRYLYP